MTWSAQGGSYQLPLGAALAVTVSFEEGFSLALQYEERVLSSTSTGEAYPSAPLAFRRGGAWHTPVGAPRISLEGETLTIQWYSGVALALCPDDGGVLDVRFVAPGADAVALGLECQQDEHYYGLGERFDRLDQRGNLLDLWVANHASGTETYKPIPFFTSSRGYGVALKTTRRVHCALGHPTLPWCTTLTVEDDVLDASVLPGPQPGRVLDLYTARAGRPPLPPEWAFLPWKSRDWRTENQATVIEDIRKHRELGIACGVKLIDAGWEAENHSFTFDADKYPDPAAVLSEAEAAGMRVVVWISPSMTTGGAAYREAAERGFLIRNAQGEAYVHRLGNEPGWVGSGIDFTNRAAVEWWQSRLRRLLEMGIRGFKTDFGEQIPVDAVFADGRSGAEVHNVYPLLYNRATWEVVREYDGILLARSAWAGSQAFPGVWAGDQSADFSPWAGLPSAIVAGQSAGWSGFPYWGSDVGGYFGTPDDEVFVRWAQFAALTPIMESHGLGKREPWDFQTSTLETFRRYANLHAWLAPYTRAAAAESLGSGMPIMRAMALCFADLPEAHQDWVQYQYLYGPDLLVAPVYSWGTTRQILFPPGEWIDFFDGGRYVGPSVQRVRAPLEKLPLFVRAGAVLPSG